MLSERGCRPPPTRCPARRAARPTHICPSQGLLLKSLEHPVATCIPRTPHGSYYIRAANVYRERALQQMQPIARPTHTHLARRLRSATETGESLSRPYVPSLKESANELGSYRTKLD